MNMYVNRMFLLGLAIMLTGSWIQAKGPKISDPANVDKDYAVQGEYSGVLNVDGEKLKFAAQVIALGKGKFQGVVYEGGLPGDGWNHKTPLERIEGSIKDGQVLFPSENGVGTLKGGKIHVADLNENAIGTLDRVVRESPTLGRKPPKGATVLFDGSSVKGWKNGKITPDKLLIQGTTSLETFQDHHLHIEFRLPYQPEDRGQGRGNSGIYVQGRYEVQMLDSFGLAGKQNECGGLYSVKDPDMNMCLPPLQWQTYDIDYQAAKFDAQGKLASNPRITVRHNGVVIHRDVELPGNRSTTAAPSKPGPAAGPVYLQNHGCPVRYRNVWVVKSSGAAK